MYWLASDSTWTSSSRSRKPAGTMIFLVMTAAAGRAMATNLVDVPMRFQARLTASATASRLVMLPSTTASRGNVSIA
jgi:hypothetical protein